jgi:hypothetical protein
MTAFHTIAVSHEDILAGRLTLDVFAADLWEVYHGRAPSAPGGSVTRRSCAESEL